MDATDVRVKQEGSGTVHVLVRVPEPRPSKTLCGKIVSGLVWWPGMPVTSNPPAFDSEPEVTCPACLAKLT